MHMTSQGLLPVGNSGRQENSKQSNMVLLFFVVFQRLIKPMKTLVLFRTLARGFRGLTALKVTATARFHRPVAVLRVVESKELCKKRTNLIACKEFSATTGHRVCSLHFPGGCKTYIHKPAAIFECSKAYTNELSTNNKSTECNSFVYNRI
jgi:hypothetical protein